MTAAANPAASTSTMAAKGMPSNNIHSTPLAAGLITAATIQPAASQPVNSNANLVRFVMGKL
jgi:hypothetical protein